MTFIASVSPALLRGRSWSVHSIVVRKETKLTKGFETGFISIKHTSNIELKSTFYFKDLAI